MKQDRWELPWEVKVALEEIKLAVLDWRQGRITYTPGTPEYRLMEASERLLQQYARGEQDALR